MMGRWGLEGMTSFEQISVARKEDDKLERTPCGCGHSSDSAETSSGL